jgi:hypothetical protein
VSWSPRRQPRRQLGVAAILGGIVTVLGDGGHALTGTASLVGYRIARASRPTELRPFRMTWTIAALIVPRRRDHRLLDGDLASALRSRVTLVVWTRRHCRVAAVGIPPSLLGDPGLPLGTVPRPRLPAAEWVQVSVACSWSRCRPRRPRRWLSRDQVAVRWTGTPAHDEAVARWYRDVRAPGD